MKHSSIPTIPGKSKPYVIAHRGNKIKCPENTIAAFEQAIADGADIIETDLHLSADEEFICIHDPTVDRTTNGSGQVGKMTLAELKTLSAFNGRPEFSRERIPILRELIGLLPKDVALAVELKSDRFLEKEVCHKLIMVLKETGILSRTMALSFSLDRLEALQAVSPEIHTGWITLSRIRPLKGPQMLGPFWPILLLNPFYVRIAHSRQQAVCPLDTIPKRRLWLYRWLGCDAILTDDPDVTCRALNKPPKK